MNNQENKYLDHLIKNRNIIIGIILLISLDLIIKFVIQAYYFDKHLNIWGEIISFAPKLNKNISWIASRFDIDIGYLPHLFFRCIILIISINIAKNILKKHKLRLPLCLGLILGLAGIFSSVIDQLIFSTSLDYIRINGLFTFDLKDVYITIGEVIAFIMLFKYLLIKENRNKLNSMKDLELLHIIFSYCKF